MACLKSDGQDNFNLFMRDYNTSSSDLVLVLRACFLCATGYHAVGLRLCFRIYAKNSSSHVVTHITTYIAKALKENGSFKKAGYIRIIIFVDTLFFVFNNVTFSRFALLCKFTARKENRHFIMNMSFSHRDISNIIMQTFPCNEHPLTPHFYIEKLGFTGLYMFFFFLFLL